MIRNRFKENINAISRLEVIRNVHKKRKTDNQATFRMEDYLEAIYELIDHKGYATSIDLAECLNVSQPSVTKMMLRLDRTELIDYEKYRGIRLTEKGIKLAKSIHEIEHHIHPETLRKLQDLLEGKNAISALQ